MGTLLNREMEGGQLQVLTFWDYWRAWAWAAPWPEHHPVMTRWRIGPLEVRWLPEYLPPTQAPDA